MFCFEKNKFCDILIMYGDKVKNKYNDVMLYKILRPIVTLLFKLVYRPKIIGIKNIPKSGRIILAGNHTNYFDCLLLISSTKRNIHFLAKKELFKGLKKILFSNLGLIPVDRKRKNESALNDAYKYLNNDKVIGIFPEGTIGKNGILPFKIGAVKMARETDSLIIPFKITGKYKLFFNDLKIQFGEPISIKSNDLEYENIKLRNKVVRMVD